MFSWRRKPPKTCTSEDVQFFLLLCLGRGAEHESEIFRRTGTGCFAVLKSLLGSTEFVHSVLHPLKLKKPLAGRPYSPAQQSLLKKGAKRHLRISLGSPDNHSAALKLVAKSSRFLNAIESADNGYNAAWFASAIETLDLAQVPEIIGKLESLSPSLYSGYALDIARPSECLRLEFYINGYFVGTSVANERHREAEDTYPGFPNAGFQHSAQLPAHLADLDHLVLSVFDSETGVPACQPKEFANMGARQQHHILKLTQALEIAKKDSPAALQTAISGIEDALPALQQYSAFPISAYAQYKQLYAAADAPATAQHIELIFPNGCAALKNDRADGWFQQAAAKSPEAMLFFSDHEQQINDGKITPVIKAAFDYDELLTRPDYAQAFAIRPDALALFDTQNTTDINATDLWLQLYEKFGDKGFCHIPQILFGAPDKQTDTAEFQRTIEAHFARTGARARTTLEANDKYAGPHHKHLNIHWPLAEETPLLAIIVPMRDTLILTRNCINSVRATLAHPEATEIIIVDNGSSDPDTKDWLHSVDAMDGIRVLVHDAPFNWAEINNKAVATSKADYLLFLNNDTAALEFGWDTVLRGYLNRQDVGIVGARLLFEDGTIQFAGYIVNPVNIAMKEAYGENPGEGGYHCRSQLPHACSALIGAFMGCRRDVFEKAGGFDAEHFPVAYNDIDFCLSAERYGYKSLYVPAITFHHFESKSRGYDVLDEVKSAHEQKAKGYFLKKWGNRLNNDPWYSDTFVVCEPTHSLLAAPQKTAITTKTCDKDS